VQLDLVEQSRSDELLERGDRDGLPVLEWTISHNGAQVTGRSYAQPGSRTDPARGSGGTRTRLP
jgi:hypothetical protein